METQILLLTQQSAFHHRHLTANLHRSSPVRRHVSRIQTKTGLNLRCNNGKATATLILATLQLPFREHSTEGNHQVCVSLVETTHNSPGLASKQTDEVDHLNLLAHRINKGQGISSKCLLTQTRSNEVASLHPTEVEAKARINCSTRMNLEHPCRTQERSTECDRRNTWRM